MPPTPPVLAQWYAKIGGQVVTDMMPDVKSIEVDSSLFLPDMCVIELNDALKWVDDARIAVGKPVVVEARSSDSTGGPATQLFAGEIVSIEGDFREQDHNFLVVRCYDRSHRFQHGSKTRTWTQVSDSDVARRIASDRGLSAEVDATAQTHRQIFQDNVSDFEFLTERARAAGRIFKVVDRKLLFKKPENLGRPTVELDIGPSLLEFRPRITVSSQVKSVRTRSWDPKNKRAIVGHSQNGLSLAEKSRWAKKGHQLFSADMGEPGELIVTDHALAEQPEADSVADALLSEIWASDFRADGIALGNPLLQPGGKVRIVNRGRFNGEYLVTSVRHVHETGHYLTHFRVSGLRAETTADLILQGSEVGRTTSGRITHGLAVGIVTNNRDPENWGRVKVKFPTFDDTLESYWVRLATPMAGSGRGLMLIPEVNDEVIVGFEHGDFNRPVVIGAVWNGADAPPEPASRAIAGGNVNHRILKTRAGHIILLDDTPGAEKIEIVDKTGKDRITIESAQQKLTIEMQGDIAIKSTAGNVTIEGLNISIKATAQATVEAAAKTSIKGGLVEIN